MHFPDFVLDSLVPQTPYLQYYPNPSVLRFLEGFHQVPCLVLDSLVPQTPYLQVYPNPSVLRFLEGFHQVPFCPVR
jgi:hypothetical protein